MKVICRFCNRLIDEKQAIKMSEKDYRIWLVVKTGHPQQSFIHDYSYTQICTKCWRAKNDVDMERGDN